MAITINWPTKVIYVPKADLTLLQASPTEIRELNLNNFRLALKALESGDAGIPWPTTHSHNPPVIVGGVTLARVVELINDYTVTFEDGQYAVNLVGANSNVADRVNVNQVSVRASNSAGLVQTREIEFASFAGAVALDFVNGTAGTVYPVGTLAVPSNNLADAKLIAEIRGLNTLLLKPGYFLFGGTDDLSGYVIRGEHATQVQVEIQPSANVTATEFRDLFMVNCELDGLTYLNHVAASGLSDFQGFAENCLLSGVTALNSSTATYFVDCKSGCVGLGSTDLPKIDLAATGPFNIAFRNWSGPIKLLNSTNASNTVCIDVTSGSTVILDATCTAGTIYVRGVANIINNSTMTVLTDALVNKGEVSEAVWTHATAITLEDQINIAQAILRNKTVTDPSTGIMTVYDVDGSTPLLTAQLYENAVASQPYRGQGAEYRGRLQ